MSEVINRVAYRGERAVLMRHGKGVAALVSLEDLALLDRIEDEYWGKEGLKVEREMKRKGEKPIPMEEVRRSLGLGVTRRRKAGKSRKRLR